MIPVSRPAYRRRVGVGAIVKQREPRRQVLVKARMRVGSDWRDVSIRNVSSRGMMLASDEPPPPGAYIEIRKTFMTIVARAVWARDGFFGIRTQDDVDFDELMENAKGPPAGWKPGMDRRTADRAAQHRPAEKAGRGRQFARAFQFAAITGAVVGLAALLAHSLWETLMRFVEPVTSALG